MWEIFGNNLGFKKNREKSQMNSVMVLKTETERKRKREIVEKQKRLLLIDRGFNIFLFSYNEFHS